jgi:signal transduction histidine kinase
MVSHELRTPLTSLTGFIELVLDGAGGEVKPPMKRLLNKAYTNGVRLSRLVADILDISRLESGNLALEMSEVSLQGLLAELGDSMLPQFQEKLLEVRFRFPEKLRAVWADRERCVQVFSNLLTNALRYTQAGGQSTFQENRLATGSRFASETPGLVFVPKTRHGYSTSL